MNLFMRHYTSAINKTGEQIPQLAITIAMGRGWSTIKIPTIVPTTEERNIWTKPMSDDAVPAPYGNGANAPATAPGIAIPNEMVYNENFTAIN